MGPPTASILDLPPDVTQSIVEALDPRSRGAMKDTCRAFRWAVGEVDARAPPWDRIEAATPRGIPLPNPTTAIAACPATGRLAVASFELTGPRVRVIRPGGPVEEECRIRSGDACVPKAAAWCPDGSLSVLLGRASYAPSWSAWVLPSRAEEPAREFARGYGEADLSPTGDVAWISVGVVCATRPSGAEAALLGKGAVPLDPSNQKWDWVRWARTPGGPLAARDANTGRIWVADPRGASPPRSSPPTEIDTHPAAVGDGWIAQVDRLSCPLFVGPDARLRRIEPSDAPAAAALEEILGLAPQAAGPGWTLAPTRSCAGRAPQAVRIDRLPGSPAFTAYAVPLPFEADVASATGLGAALRVRWDARVPGLAIARAGYGPRLVRFW